MTKVDLSTMYGVESHKYSSIPFFFPFPQGYPFSPSTGVDPGVEKTLGPHLDLLL